MDAEVTFQTYVSDQEHMRLYAEYQKKYRRTIRESDKVLIEIVRGLAGERLRQGVSLSLLDIGCSTGNLLFHLKHLLPGIHLSGGDIVADIIAECRTNTELTGVLFEEMDMFNLNEDKKFDFVVANAALMFFSEQEFDGAVQSIAAVTKPEGWFVAFDFFHQFDQEVMVVERSKLHPHNLKFHFRNYSKVKASLDKARFLNPSFRPFRITVDLDKPVDPSDITSYTVRTDDGERLCFRGTVFQPWCHLVAQKQS